ncbi:hypothetical protein D3C86_391880 [compost metagenome]
MTETKPWIPPFALMAGMAGHGLSWLLLALTAWPNVPGLTFPALAWIHLVALGWLTMIALAVLVHVIPGFLDTDWELEPVARWALLPYGIGTALLVGAFLGIGPWAFQWGGGLLVASLISFMIPAFLTMIRYKVPAGTKVPYRFAFSSVLTALLLAALLGATMAWALAGAPWSHLLATLLPLHAILAGGGWLSLLILGVSARTIFPVTGRKRYLLPFHVVISAGFFGGLLLLLLGLLPGVGHVVWRWLGVALAGLAATLYLVDIGRVLWKAPNPNRPPQAFIAASLVYFVLMVILGAGVNAGMTSWQAPLAFVALVGWMGQSVNGYLLHIGIRLMLTMVRGEEDETAPGEVTPATWSWTAFGLFQLAILWGVGVLLAGHGEWLPLSGVLGLLGWFWLVGSVWFSYRRARLA